MQVSIIRSTVVAGKLVKLKADKNGDPVPQKMDVDKDTGRLLINSGKALPVEGAA